MKLEIKEREKPLSTCRRCRHFINGEGSVACLSCSFINSKISSVYSGQLPHESPLPDELLYLDDKEKQDELPSTDDEEFAEIQDKFISNNGSHLGSISEISIFKNVINDLPSSQRAIIERITKPGNGDISWGKLAVEFGIPKSTVRMRYRNAVRKLNKNEDLKQLGDKRFKIYEAELQEAKKKRKSRPITKLSWRIPDLQKSFTCPLCNTVSNHKRNHGSYYQCDFCNQEFYHRKNKEVK